MNDFSKKYWSNNILEMITKINKVLETSKGVDERMKDKLKIKIWNYKNIVLFEVLEQDESLRNEDVMFKASNGWRIKSVANPDITTYCKIIYIRGSDNNDDKGIIVHRLRTAKEAKQIVKDVRQAVKEFNESQNQILDDAEKEYLSKVIEPFRNQVRFIVKCSWCCKEFIRIGYYQIEKFEYLDFPLFKLNTMYKGMQLNKEYTLEELGL